MFITWSQLLLQAINSATLFIILFHITLKAMKMVVLPSRQQFFCGRIICECSKCTVCEGAEKSLLKNTKAAKGKEPAQPVGSKAPLTLTSKERLVATVQQQREIVKELEGRISELEVEIEKNSITVNESLEKDLLLTLAIMI